jgi:DNA-binding Lrp family transcriptional regulator
VIVDDINRKILELLWKNSRLSYIDIGKKVNLSRVAVKTRIDNMMEKGIIEDFTILVNAEMIGRSISVYFDIIAEPKHIYPISDKLKEIDNITDIYHMTGGKLHVHGVFNDKKELSSFLENTLYPMEGIISVSNDMIIDRIKKRVGLGL